MVVIPNSPRQELLSSLRGRQVIVPDLQAIFHDWPQAVNPELATLSKDVDIKLES